VRRRHAVRAVWQRGALAFWLSVAAAGFTAGAGAAWHVQAWRWRAADADRMELEREARRGQELRADGAAVRYEATRAGLQQQRQVLTREIERVVEVPLYRDVCLDADGLRVVAAAAGADPDPGQPAPAVPAASASAR
jgi:hypothetical protein